MSTMDPENVPTPPKSLSGIVLLASAASAIASLGGLYLAVIHADAILWASLGFLLVMLCAAALGVIAGLGRFASGYGLAAVSISGSILGGALFSWRDLASNVGRDPQFGSLLLPWLGFHAVCAAVILVAGAIAVLSRNPKSWGAVARSAAFLVPAAVILLVGYFGWDRLPQEDGGRAIAFGLLLLGGAIIGGLVSVGGHFLIRAFEITDDVKAP